MNSVFSTFNFQLSTKMRPLILLLTLTLLSCRTVRQTEAVAHTQQVSDTIRQHLIVHRTDSVIVLKTDSGTQQREKTKIIVYADHKQRHNEQQRDTVTIVRTATPQPSATSSNLPLIILAVALLVLIIKRR